MSFSQSARARPMNERREKIHMEHPLPKTLRCQLLEVPRSTAYYQPTPLSAQDLALMRLIDEIHLQYPFYGSRRLWRSVKYENIYLRAYETPTALGAGLARYFEFYNASHRHSALHRRTPDAVCFEQAAKLAA